MSIPSGTIAFARPMALAFNWLHRGLCCECSASQWRSRRVASPKGTDAAYFAAGIRGNQSNREVLLSQPGTRNFLRDTRLRAPKIRTHKIACSSLWRVLCHRSVSRCQRVVLFCKSFVKFDLFFAVRWQRLVVGPVRGVGVRMEHTTVQLCFTESVVGSFVDRRR